MTCSSCVATVTKAIESIRNVKNVTVSLDPGLAVIESNEDVSIDVIHSVLPDKFSVKPFKLAGTATSIILGFAKLRLFIISAYCSFELT